MRNQPRQADKKDTLAKSQDWIAGVLAGLVVFFGIPHFFDLTSPMVASFTANHYSSEIVGLTTVVWWLIGAVGLYFLANAVALSFVRVAFAKFFVRLFR